MYKVEGVLFRPSDGAALQEVLTAFDTAAKNTPIEQPPHAVPQLSRTVAIRENQGTAWFEPLLARLCPTLQFGTFLPVRVPGVSDAEVDFGSTAIPGDPGLTFYSATEVKPALTGIVFEEMDLFHEVGGVAIVTHANVTQEPSFTFLLPTTAGHVPNQAAVMHPCGNMTANR